MLNFGNEDFLPALEIAKLQHRRWESQRHYVAGNSGFYQHLWDGVPVPNRLQDVSNLPLCDKEMLRESQVTYPPLGNYLAAQSSQLIRVHRTSGTTGQAMNVALTRADAEQTARIGARSYRASGLRPGDLVIHCLNYQMWTGGVTDHLSLEATGATVIPFGIGNSELLIQTVLDLKVDAIQSTPSYPAVLEKTICEYFPGIQPQDLGLRLGLFGGEAGLDNTGFRRRLEETWGYAVRNANYGVSDVFSNFAGQCDKNNDLHFVGHDVLHAEIVDPIDDSVVAWQEGNSGELVLTHLARQAQPLVRFRTNDVVVVTGTDKCACGRTTPRFRVLGRTDDMIVVRGVNVYPSAVGGVINNFPELSGEFRIRLRGKAPYDRLEIEAELLRDVAPSERLAEDIERAIKFNVRASARVNLVPPYNLPRTEGKTQRLIREDP